MEKYLNTNYGILYYLSYFNKLPSKIWPCCGLFSFLNIWPFWNSLWTNLSFQIFSNPVTMTLRATLWPPLSLSLKVNVVLFWCVCWAKKCVIRTKAMRLTETEPIFRSSSTLKNQTEPNGSYILKDKNKSNRTEPIHQGKLKFSNVWC